MQEPGVQELSASPATPEVSQMESDLWQLINLQGSPTKMSLQVKQLSSASSSSINKEKMTPANMSDEEPQDDQELVNIADAEKQSGTER